MPALILGAVDPAGARVPARFHVTDTRGAVFPVAGAHVAMRNERDWASERHFVSEAPVELEVAPGGVSIVVERGPEFLPQAVELELAAGERRNLDLEVRRWVDMNARGWFSGDLHVHRPAEHMPLLLRAEDLNVGTTIGVQWRDDPPTPDNLASEAGPWLSVIDERHAFSRIDSELERIGAGPGAVVAVGLERAVSFPCQRWYPPDSAYADAARAAGGHVDAEKPVWELVPVLAALGRLDSVGLVCNHFARGGTDLELGRWGGRLPADATIRSAAELARWMCSLYYRLLGCGLRLPVSGGSATGIMPNPLGFNRTYVRLDGGFSYPAWMAGLKGGRSFATNGPMLTLTAEGHEPGDEIRITGTRTLRVRAEAEWSGPIESLELVLDGEVIADQRGSRGARVTVIEREVEVSASGWIAARAFAGAEPTIRFAHTSPIYLSAAAAPRALASDAGFLAGWIAETHERAMRDLADEPPDRREAVLADLTLAERWYRALAAGEQQF